MNNHSDIDESMLQSHTFELPRTLDELGWSEVLGPSGLGWQLMEWMQALAEPLFVFTPLRAQREGHGEVLFFEVEGVSQHIDLEPHGSLIATLLSGVREVINGVNHALKCAQLEYRFVLERQISAGHHSCYRLILAPHAVLAGLGRSLHLVAGITPEVYERHMLVPDHTLHPLRPERPGSSPSASAH